MPPTPEKKKVVQTSPSPGLLERLFGSPTSPNMQAGIDMARQENPNLGDVHSYGLLSRMLMGGAKSYTSPTKSIYLNSRQLDGLTPDQIADSISHESEHVDQMNDNQLSAPREFINELFGKAPAPAVNRGFQVPHDVNLPLNTGPSPAKLNQLVKKR